ncbi:MAG: insulinase family protein [Lachnospiraceae bacterium]|nr:insulinase family protein [Lachnospiraceae bacterium]
MKIENLPAYRLIDHHYSEDVRSDAWILEHKKSGAHITVLENDEENKVFYIAFRTPPKDSTGVAHILEHSVLCGSEAFPLKDPFVELAKGSLNTFLNAMTYSDKTVYPVASCNDQDFRNLMHVYMDAVLHPNIYREKKIFLQEGWHYETDENDNIVINGVVYNEMKGAFSSPDDVVAREIFSSLYPDTTYGVESGGNPQFIPDLSYEEFLEFHKSFYHPANSFIYLYGNADMEERLNWLDSEYLSAYDRIEVDSLPKRQAPFAEPRKMRKEFPITDEEREEKQTYLSYNAVIGDVMDPELYLAFQVIDYALVDADGTPLRRALLQAGIGTEISSTYENGILQPYYSVVAKNADEADLPRFEEIVASELKRITEEDFDHDALLASINSMEFRFREADMGSYPRGLIWGLKALDSWLYDKERPLIHLESLSLFEKLRQKIGTSYYRDLVKKYLLDNPHRSVLVVAPKRGLTAEREKALAEKLAKYKDSLGEEKFKALKEEALALKTFQETEDSEEKLACLPILKRSDLRREVLPLYNREMEMDGAKLLYHEVDTNGILYLNLLFDCEALPIRLYPYFGLFGRCLCAMDTEHYAYEQLGYEIDKTTGSFGPILDSALPGQDLKNYKRYLSMQLSVLRPGINNAVALLKEVLLTTKFDDPRRLKELVAEGRSALAGFMMRSGHTVAAAHALSYLSETGLGKETISGLGLFRFLEDAEEHFDERKDEIISGLKEIRKFIFRKDNLLIDVTGSQQELDALKGQLTELIGALNDSAPSEEKGRLIPEKKNEAFTTSAQVQYVARVGNFKEHGLEFTGALRVLKTIMGYEYLWNEVRVKGGAYGCMSSFSTSGELSFVSYRDPNLEQTMETYEKAVEFIRNFKADEKKMTKYIIGTLSDIDVPRTPRTTGSASLHAWLDQLDERKRQEMRDQVLDATQEDIRALAAHVEAALSDEAWCVVGNEEKIRSSKERFGAVLPLFRN